MELTDVRRLTGVNFLSDRSGAAAEAAVPDECKGVAIALWRRHMRALLDAVGWGHEHIRVRAYTGGASLMVSAPVDALYTATEMIEFTWDVTCEELASGKSADIEAAAEGFNAKVADESDPLLIALATAASERGVTFLGHDDHVSVGLGTGCTAWPDGDLPEAGEVDWAPVHDVPVAMVTGTNGKSTTVRLTAAIGTAAGRTVGLSSSDWVRVGNEIVDEGDYSGPAGARLAVRDPRVDLAVIETARGGLLRRGLPVPQADACLITNIAADHLGSYGIMDVAALGDAKFLLAHAVKPGGRLVLNGDDPELVARSAGFAGDITWYGLDLDRQAFAAWAEAGGHAAFIVDDMMILAHGSERFPVIAVADFAPGLGGAAKFNISNALGAIALASALELPVAAMTEALSSFRGTPEENPGRGNFLQIGGVSMLVDFAHNPHGVSALADAVKDIPANRRLFLLGQAGDRSDGETRELTRAVWSAQPDMIIAKELETKLRGRNPGDVPAVIVNELRSLGAPADAVRIADTEMDSVRMALEWSKPGDFLVLLLHGDRAPAMALLDKLKSSGWQAGDPLPDRGEFS